MSNSDRDWRKASADCTKVRLSDGNQLYVARVPLELTMRKEAALNLLSSLEEILNSLKALLS
jgi:hypothetical protein